MDEVVPKSNVKMIGVFIAIAVVVAIAYWWIFVRKNKKESLLDTSSVLKEEDEGGITIYGSLGCPYTIKQMEKYPNHKFVDCTSGGCPDFVTAYPTTKYADGKIEVGFS